MGSFSDQGDDILIKGDDGTEEGSVPSVVLDGSTKRLAVDTKGTVQIDSAGGPAVYGTLSVGTSATLVKVGASALANRVTVIIQPQANGIYLGYDSSVTTSNGIRLFKHQIVELDVTEDVTVYLIAASGTNDVRIQEIGQ